MRRPRSWLQIVHPDDRERVRLARKGLPDAEYDIEYRGSTDRLHRAEWGGNNLLELHS